MEHVSMYYDDTKLRKHCVDVIKIIGDIKIKEIQTDNTFKDSNKKGEKIHIFERYDDLITTLINPKSYNQNLNNVIESIDITLDLLVYSYGLMKLQEDNLKISTKPNYIWFVYYVENIISRIYTMYDLLWNFINEYYRFGVKQNNGLINNVYNKLENKNHKLYRTLGKIEFEAHDIRNDFTHNPKPFLYSPSVTIRDKTIYVGQAERKLNLKEVINIIDNDINLLSSKYKELIKNLRLDTILM